MFFLGRAQPHNPKTDEEDYQNITSYITRKDKENLNENILIDHTIVFEHDEKDRGGKKIKDAKTIQYFTDPNNLDLLAIGEIPINSESVEFIRKIQAGNLKYLSLLTGVENIHDNSEIGFKVNKKKIEHLSFVETPDIRTSEIMLWNNNLENLKSEIIKKCKYLL